MINNDSTGPCSSKITRISTVDVPPKAGQKSLRELIADRRNTMKGSAKTAAEVKIKDPHEAVNNYKNIVNKGTAFIEQMSTNHYCLWDSSYPENPERTACIKRRLEALDLLKRCEIIQPEIYSEELYFKKHTKDLYERLKNSSLLSEVELQQESSKWDSIYFTQDTFECAKSAANAAITLVSRIAKGDFTNGFALIRPPGHHAMANAFCGYCFINNVAIAAEAALSEGYAKKILIVDYDVHHGQGTQKMFYNRNDVLYFSIHRFEHGEFWPNLRESDSDYIGEGPGKGFNVNVPLNKTALGDSDYLAIIFNLLLPLAYEFNPDLIIISAGYDAAIGCPEFNPDLIIVSAGFDSCLGDEKGQMNVNPHFYGHLISLLSGLANGKIAVCLEGGYFTESLAEGASCTLKALLGDACYPLNIHSNPVVHSSLQEVINNVKYFLHDYWECFKCEKLFEYPKKSTLSFDEEDEHVTRTDFSYIPVETTTFETSDCYPIQDDEEKKFFLSAMKQLREEYMSSRVYENNIGYVYDDELLKHRPTTDTGKTPHEKPERLTEIMKHFKDFGLTQRCQKIDQSQFDEKSWLEKVHSFEYIKNILSQYKLLEKPDWYFNNHTTNCILKSVSWILSLVQNISKGVVRAGVAIIRPPGHHASSNSGSGFCFVNNVVIAAEYLIQEEHYKRVLIVDFDIHHGNGTQDLTYKRSDILYISVHRFDGSKFFPSLPEADYSYTGKDSGKGYNINIPFNKGGKSDIDYWMVWHKIVLPIAFSYNPDFVIISAGFDAGIYDPLGGGYKVTPEMFGHMVHTLKSLASGRILLALEGGYHIETTALSMITCIKSLLGDPLPTPSFSGKVADDTLETIRNVVVTHRDKWSLLKVNKKLANFSYTEKIKRLLEELYEIASKDSDAKKQVKDIINQCRGQTLLTNSN